MFSAASNRDEKDVHRFRQKSKFGRKFHIDNNKAKMIKLGENQTATFSNPELDTWMIK